MLKRLIEWIKSLFRKTTTNLAPETPAPSVTPANVTPAPSVTPHLDSLPASTRAFIATGAVAEELDRRVREQGPGVDRRGGDLNNGFVRVNEITEGSELTYFVTVGPGERFVRLVGLTHSGSSFEGTEFVVTGPKSFSGKSGGAESQKTASLIRQNLPPGSYVVKVKYLGVQGGERGTAAQCWQDPPQPHHVSHTSY